MLILLQVDRILVPDTYDSSWTNFQDDIAVAILKHAFTYNGYIRPICLDFDRELDNAQLSQGNVGRVSYFPIIGYHCLLLS